MRRLRDGIECLSAGRHVLLPAESVEQIVEYEVTSLPLARPHIGGIGVLNAHIVVSVRLDGERELPCGKRTTTGVLLVGSTRSKKRWALEVTRVLSLVKAEPGAAPSGGWLSEATTDDGRTLPWVRVSDMLADLGEGRDSR